MQHCTANLATTAIPNIHGWQRMRLGRRGEKCICYVADTKGESVAPTAVRRSSWRTCVANTTTSTVQCPRSTILPCHVFVYMTLHPTSHACGVCLCAWELRERRRNDMIMDVVIVGIMFTGCVNSCGC